MLYIIPTPIGNLGDWTFRAAETSKLCDYLLSEDTRHTKILLDHYEIEKKLISFHKFNEKEKEEGVIADLKSGKTIGLLSDAGTPLIQDPGQGLVNRCYKEEIPVTALPGACALITALSLAGRSEPFQFLGFLPKKKGERHRLFIKALFFEGTTLFYESPHQLLDSLEELKTLSPHAPVAVARELTKLHEELLSSTAEELFHHFSQKAPRGEIVLLVEGTPLKLEMPTLALVEELQREFGLSQKEAIEVAAHLKNLRKKEIYNEVHGL